MLIFYLFTGFSAADDFPGNHLPLAIIKKRSENSERFFISREAVRHSYNKSIPFHHPSNPMIR